ncbi:MAG TPA: acyl-CoA dehydrogenase family protein [Thermomicrobiales bacterium]|nr:acyl-CoA dehydrogenase family protein [Thermomicrobiales bacterium]
MDLRYTAEDEAFRARVRAWLAHHAPRAPLRTVAAKKAWHRALYEAGYLGMGWPRAYGGREARPIEQAIVVEEMARANAPGSVNWAGLGLVGPTLIHHGTAAQRERYLRPILLGDEIWCQLYSEPNAGSDLASLRTRADLQDCAWSGRDGDHFVVNGQKIWTSTAPEADLGILLARTDPQDAAWGRRDAPKHQGISYLIVDMHQPGIEVRPLRQLTGIADEFAEVFFTDARVPADNLIGELHAGWRIAQTTLSYERGGDTMGIVARLQRSFARLLEIVGTPRGDGTRRVDDPLVRQKLGQIMAEIEVLRYTSLRILSTLEQGGQPGPESSIAKLHYSELDKRVNTLMLEILGPFGQLTAGVPAAYAYAADGRADAHGNWPYLFMLPFAETIYAGSSEIQKNIIGERVLGLPKEVRADRLARAAGVRGR